MGAAKCFEVTQVLDLIEALKSKLFVFDKDDIDPPQFWGDERLSFLPAPKTWIEYTRRGHRFGVLLESLDTVSIETRPDLKTDGMPQDRDNYALVTIACLNDHQKFGFKYFAIMKTRFLPKTLTLKNLPWWPLSYGQKAPFDNYKELSPHIETATTVCSTVYAALALINTPKTIHREDHQPHRGLAREILRNSRSELVPWTEVKLHITVPPSGMDSAGGDRYLTGKRALHFCRSHLRLTYGKVVIITSHWRGDPSLGTTQSRYAVEI